MLPELDVAGQQKLVDASVLVVGMGGLGCPVAMYLAAAGVGSLTLADDDSVELTNLQRQIAHGEKNLGEPKVESAAATLRGLNPDVELTLLHRRLQGEDLERVVQNKTVVVDATDNFSTRFALNDACLKAKVPLVSGAAIRMEGQVMVFDPRQEDSPCYQCLYQRGDDEDASCARNGVMAPVVGIVGSVQAMEAIKVIAGIGNSLVGRLLLLDALTMQWRELRLHRDPKCAACGQPEGLTEAGSPGNPPT
jgi:adenylyltransferase/sulfurtransferase